MTYDEARIARERAICERASEGPWRGYPGAYLTTNGYKVCQFVTGAIETPNADADWEFIAAARTAWPEAIEEIERLRCELNQAVLERDLTRQMRNQLSVENARLHNGLAAICDEIQQSPSSPAIDRLERTVRCVRDGGAS